LQLDIDARTGRCGSINFCVKVTIPHQSGRTEEFEQRCVSQGEGCGL